MIQLVRVGRTSSVQSNKMTARVIFDDYDESVSDELPIIVHGTLKERDKWLPAENEQVLCLFTSNGQGFIVGSIYSEVDKPPS